MCHSAASLFSTLSHRRQVFFCFYIKPLVRYYYYFYTSDHMNAVYNIICIRCKIYTSNSKPNRGPNLLSQKHIRTDRAVFNSKTDFSETRLGQCYRFNNKFYLCKACWKEIVQNLEKSYHCVKIYLFRVWDKWDVI